MTTRFDAKGNTIPSGYSNPNKVDDVTIPSCGIEDVDRALFALFNTEIPLYVGQSDAIKKANVIFASGERWAMLKKKKELRDKNGSLILPLITIGRTSVVQDIKEDITGRGINQQTGELVIDRRLHSSDRGYQNLLNKLFIKNSNTTAVDTSIALPGQLSTSLLTAELSLEPDVRDGVLLSNNFKNNVWETLTVPSPQFFTAHYEVTFWSQYTSHMTQLIDTFIASQLPQGNAFKVSNPLNSSYWFIATVEGNDYQTGDNFDDMTEKERVIKYTFKMKVPAYIFATSTPGAPVPVRRYVSSPRIDFTFDVDENISLSSDPTMGNDPYLGSDDPTLPMEHDLTTQLSYEQRHTGHERLQYHEGISSNDPALSKLPRGTHTPQYYKVPVVGPDGITRYRNVRVAATKAGEKTFSASDISLSDIDFIVTK